MVLSLKDQLQECEATIIELKFNLLRAQQKMNDYEDKKRQEENFKVGDKV